MKKKGCTQHYLRSTGFSHDCVLHNVVITRCGFALLVCPLHAQPLFHVFLFWGKTLYSVCV